MNGGGNKLKLHPLTGFGLRERTVKLTIAANKKLKRLTDKWDSLHAPVRSRLLHQVQHLTPGGWNYGRKEFHLVLWCYNDEEEWKRWLMGPSSGVTFSTTFYGLDARGPICLIACQVATSLQCGPWVHELKACPICPNKSKTHHRIACEPWRISHLFFGGVKQDDKFVWARRLETAKLSTSLSKVWLTSNLARSRNSCVAREMKTRTSSFTSQRDKHMLTDTAEIPCGHLDFESVVTAQNDEFKAVFIARIHACQTPRNSILGLDTFKYFRWMHLSHISCALGKWTLHSRWNFTSTFTELHVHGDEWPTEVTSKRISAVSCSPSHESASIRSSSSLVRTNLTLNSGSQSFGRSLVLLLIKEWIATRFFSGEHFSSSAETSVP